MRINAMIVAALLALSAVCLPPAAANEAEPVARSLPVNANIRAEPSLNAERLVTLERGRQVWVHGETNEHGWVRVSNADKTVHGWMAAYLLDEPANIATPGRRSKFAEALGEPAPAASGGTSLFSRSLGGGSGGGGDSPPPAAGGSLFAQASQSGQIERAQEEKRRREAEEARRRAEEQERQHREAEERRLQREWEEAEERRRWEQEEEERRLQEEWEWEMAELEAEESRQQVLNTIQGIERLFQQEIQQRQIQQQQIQRQQAAQRLSQERERRRQEMAHWQQQDQARLDRERQERERQARLRAEQERVLADLQRATRPAAPTYSPPPSTSRSSPSSGGGTNPASRSVREGCWGMPDPPNTTCVASSPRRSGDRFIVTHKNICSNRIVVSMCNERAGRDATCGQSGILPGRSYNWDSGKDSTGAYSVRWVGSKNSVEDWACVSQIGWRN
ncbi:MAG: SH3 domain-containing protein [Tistlia sp.]|uniref:SH3 domain-containing protein n=1 Tax=Tistlia sp. TaxID=3057121 RepID=UPI0034A59449